MLQRRDAAWLDERLHRRDTRVIAVWRGLHLIRDVNGVSPSAVMLTGAHARGLLRIADTLALLGVKDDTAYFCVDVSSKEALELTPLMGQARFQELREVGVALDPFEANLLAHGRALMHWHRMQSYCSLCAQRTESIHGGAARRCVNLDCGHEFYPRLDPAVIVLVTRSGPEGGACLLARQSPWPKGMYAVLAGFVEPGETLEDAVRREVAEETSVRVGAVAYHSSQPWPFPGSVMIGFRAEAQSVGITLNDGELEDARWCTRAQIRRFPERGLFLPRPDSLAHLLIDQWMAEG
ncbi:NAD+ diphosphatase [Varunaivibrio sulfuroxidans]|uniref:NAD(+) diphosphatase n=1 Tax=Varunaivibrio sulfuroxidans TaxID=1773489 RepID=A0A4V2UP94_9PROT|nr:NAD+ diphosphatase [Varunaivibrio sulfuroxidans]